MLPKYYIKKLLKEMYFMWEDLLNENVLEKNYLLKDIYKGQRCFILTTGRSIEEMDLSLLRNEYTFVCNFFYQHKDIKKLNPKFYAEICPIEKAKDLSDIQLPGFIYPFTDARRADIEYLSMIDLVCDNPETIFFLSIMSKKFIEKHKIFVNRRVHYAKPSSSPMIYAKNITNDLTRRMSFMDGVIFFMIASAIFMGFKEIYLCGCGYSYYPAQIFHFYDQSRFSKDMPENIRNLKMRELATRNNAEILHIKYDDDHYSPVCVIRRDVPQEHKITHEFAVSQGVDILNIVPLGFESPVYKKVSWEYVVNNVL